MRARFVEDASRPLARREPLQLGLVISGAYTGASLSIKWLFFAVCSVNFSFNLNYFKQLLARSTINDTIRWVLYEHWGGSKAIFSRARVLSFP